VKIRQLDDTGGRRTFVLVCDRGDDPVEALTAAAKRFDLRAASLTGIGAFAAVTRGFFEHARRDYRRRDIREQVEVHSLIGNVALDRGEPRVHAHVVVGRSDGAALGGHLLGGAVDPTLEITLVEAPAILRRRTDPATGLALIDLSWGNAAGPGL
jgi:predicted DNA-binding protein with PD1-like motif